MPALATVPQELLIAVIVSALVGLIGWTWSRLRKYVTRRRRSPAPAWRERLNRRFAGAVEVIKQATSEPSIEICDCPEVLTPSQEQWADAKRTDLQASKFTNDLHAMLVEEPYWDSDLVCMKATVIDFAELLSLRNDGQHPAILSACGVIVCPETKQVLLHKRHGESETFGNLIHTVGGAYQPSSERRVSTDHLSLLEALRREVKEETGIDIRLDPLPPMILSKELETGFVQLVVLGVVVSEADLRSAIGIWEGQIVLMGFDELPALLGSGQLVPSGKMQLLAWLAFGAPGAGVRRVFGGAPPRELFAQFAGD